MYFKKHFPIFLTVLFSCQMLCLPALVRSAPVPDTGVTKCYGYWGEIPCPQPGEAYYGQDAQYTINSMSYTKLDASGNNLPDSATSWTMIRDNVTGLIWENKQDMDGGPNYANPHDADNTYTWYDSNPSSNGDWPGTPGEGTDTEDFINALNLSNYGGYHDWRLPTISELGLIVDYSFYSGHINTTYFPNTAAAESSCYWSSTTYYDYQAAWYVNFNYAFDSMYDSRKDHSYYVRAVRGGQSAPLDHLVNNGDGTVTDTDTGLMWQQDTLYLNELGVVWEEALSTCENSNLAGHSDWRLPSIKELRTLVDYSRVSPAINTTYFTHMPNKLPELSFWSSTKCNEHTYDCDTYQIMFLQGGTTSVSGHAYVRAVRGGQSGSLGHLVISSPKQASTWDIGAIMPIRWETDELGTNVKISLSRQGGLDSSFVTIIETTTNDGQHNWTVSGPASVNSVIKIEQTDNPANWATEGLFVIKDQSNPDDDSDGDGYTVSQGDCNDNDAAIHPGATEICGDGIDQDCNGSDLACVPGPNDTDNDGDGFTENQGDCNDNNATIHPGATEICGDGKDNNCIGTIDEGCILPPSSLTAKSTSPTQIILGWKDNSNNETGFKIERKAGACSSGNPWAQIGAKPANAIAYTVSGLTPNTTYAFRVRAYNASSSSTYSTCASAKTALSGTQPAPSNLKAASASSTKVNLTWTDNAANETGFKIYRKVNSGAWALRTTTGPNVKSFSDTTASNNSSTASHQYYVVACNASGKSPLTYMATVPYQPVNLKAAPGTTTDAIKLTWTNKSSNETGFEIYRKSGSCSSISAWTKITTLGANRTSWTNKGLSPGSLYSYRVRAYCKAGAVVPAYGYSLWSNCAAVTVGTSPGTITNSLGMKFNYISPGTFQMGSPMDEPGRHSNETLHQVTLTKGYYMQTTEVTQGQWVEVMGNNPSDNQSGDNYPVERVAWYEIQTFIANMNLRGDGTYSLPTEAQWEYACRAGSTTAFANGGITVTDCGYDPNLAAMGWYCYNSNDTTHPVAQKQANAWGLYDMHGNVFEWCEDWLESYPTSSVTDPTGPSSGGDRVLRGGSWYLGARDCRAAIRGGCTPAYRTDFFGFRLVLLPGQ